MSIKVKHGGAWVDIDSRVKIDSTLSEQGMAAESKIVGDKFNEILEEVTIAEEKIAEVEKAVDDLPIKVSEEEEGNFTDISGVRKVTGIKIGKIEQINIDNEGETQTTDIEQLADNQAAFKFEMELTYQGELTTKIIVELNSEQRPIKIINGDVECNVEWDAEWSN